MTFFNLHTHTSTNQPTILELVNQYPWDFLNTINVYSIGIHPWFIIEERLASDLSVIRERIQEKNCLAIGECGLDKKIDIAIEVQQAIFEKQLLLAQEFNKPIIIHCVAAFDELIATKNRLKITVPIIIHGFSKSKQLAKQLIDNDFYLSFGKYLLRNPKLKEVFNSVPEDRFFLETDSETESLESIYDLAAQYKGQTITEIQETIATNFQAVFKINLDSK